MTHKWHRFDTLQPTINGRDSQTHENIVEALNIIIIILLNILHTINPVRRNALWECWHSPFPPDVPSSDSSFWDPSKLYIETLWDKALFLYLSDFRVPRCKPAFLRQKPSNEWLKLIKSWIVTEIIHSLADCVHPSGDCHVESGWGHRRKLWSTGEEISAPVQSSTAGQRSSATWPAVGHDDRCPSWAENRRWTWWKLSELWVGQRWMHRRIPLRFLEPAEGKAIRREREETSRESCVELLEAVAENEASCRHRQAGILGDEPTTKECTEIAYSELENERPGPLRWSFRKDQIGGPFGTGTSGSSRAMIANAAQ